MIIKNKVFLVLFGKSNHEDGGWYEREKEFKTLAAAIKWATHIDDNWNGIESRPVVIGAETAALAEKKRSDYWHRGIRLISTGKVVRGPKLLWDANKDN
jgi:trehalose utilization protein